jgi:8-oxo-dGTP pyrophosphatase MutT (NUDIX family)
VTAEASALRPQAKRLRPRDAATLLLVDRGGPEPRVLMGKRNPQMAFMPGKFVFPGGRVDPADRRVGLADDLTPEDLDRLMRRTTRATPSRCRALALAAIRETFEETGLAIGGGGPWPAPSGLPPVWQQFTGLGLLPAPGALTMIARAITPPGRPRRFDTRFFLADVAAVAGNIARDIGPDSELVELRWVTLDEAASLDIPVITQVILGDLKDRLAGRAADTVPFYFQRGNGFVREFV